MDIQKIILVTGSSSGFGRLTAETLARQGHTVFASMRGIEGKNAKTSAEVRALAQKEKLALHVIELDVTDDTSAEGAVAEVIEQAGRIDVLVNNAGIAYAGLSETFPVTQVQQQFDVNFFGVVRMNRAVLPHMRRQGSGLLIHISSTGGRLAMPFMGVYTASKFALEALAEAYRYELSGLGVDSVIIEPGTYPTNAPHNAVFAIDQARITDYGPLAEVPAKMIANFKAISAGLNTPSAQEVADAVADLIATPAGERPLRTIVPGLGGQIIEPLNDQAEQIQRTRLEGMGMAHLMTINK